MPIFNVYKNINNRNTLRLFRSCLIAVIPFAIIYSHISNRDPLPSAAIVSIKIFIMKIVEKQPENFLLDRYYYIFNHFISIQNIYLTKTEKIKSGA